MTSRWIVDTRLVAAAALAAVTAAIVFGVTAPPPTVGVLAVTGATPSGVRLADVEVATLQVGDPTGFVPAASAGELGDHVLRIGLEEGSPIVMSALEAPSTARAVDVIGLELGSAAAVHGALAAGDRVDVYLVGESVERIAAGVEVVGIVSDRSSIGPGDVRLLLAVDEELVVHIVSAAAEGAVHLVRRGA